jgi:hypothetical protein
MSKRSLTSEDDPSHWADSDVNLMSDTGSSSDSYLNYSWTQAPFTALPEDPGAELQPQLQAMRYALPHPSQPFSGGNIGVDYFPFGAQNWFPDVDVGFPLFD